MENKVVLISGAGRGLGRAIAIAYHSMGFNVIATDVDLSLFRDIKNKERFTCIKLDVTSESDVRIYAEIVEEKFGKLDVLISNAGIIDFYPVSETGSDRLKKIFDVNVFGLTNLTKYFLPLLINSRGRLIVISSESYKVPSPFQPYAVSKQALESLFKAVKIELSLKDVPCILIRPGAIQTKILDDTIHFKVLESESLFDKEFRRFVKTVPKYIGKSAKPCDITSVVLKAGVSKRPKPVYQMNHNPLVSVLCYLPRRIQHYIIKNSLK